MLKSVAAVVSLVLVICPSSSQPTAAQALGCVDVECRNSREEQRVQEADSTRTGNIPGLL